MMDALIFITLLGIVSMVIIGYGDMETHEPIDASDLCELVLSTDITESGLVPDMGVSRYRVADAAAYATAGNSERILEEIDGMLRELTMGDYHYAVVFTCNGNTVTIGEWNPVSESSYEGSWDVIGGLVLEVRMQLV